VSEDDGLADRVFEAAVQFLAKVGLYCLDSNRVIQFSEAEIRQACSEASGRCFAGEGRDQGILGMRHPEDPKRPWLHVGSGIVASSEGIALQLIEAYANLAEADSISISALDRVAGLPVAAGSPAEFYAALRSIRLGREATRRAGRPGLPIMNLISTAASPLTTLAASAPQFGLRPSDGWLCGAISEMKVDFGVMNKIAYLLSWGANIGAETSPILGGYCGGPAGTAVVSTAYILVGLLVHKGTYQLTFPVHFRHGCSTTRDVIWSVAASCQAASRNIPMPVIWLAYTAAGPETEMYFQESAAYLLAAVSSGAPAVQTPHPAKAVKVDGITPLEARFGVETALAATQLDRSAANEIVDKLLGAYEERVEDAPAGSTYSGCYGPDRRPSPAYADLYEETKEGLARMGIPYP
jgi:methylamine--corrinoid protein Co-methyltransferase